jgi:multidrug efflux pump subunit AcrA (membrane-fusion protein)
MARVAGLRRLAYGFLSALMLVGCGHDEESHYSSVSRPPVVEVIKPEARKIVRVVGQPSFIEAYEHTSVYPKLTAYIEKWIVDIGDKVKKDDTLATLFVPELVEDYGTKKATVKLDEQRVALAKELVKVAEADVQSAEASLVEAKAILAKYKSETDRWNTEVKRLDHEVKRGVVDPQILLESTNQWRSAAASEDAARATIAKAEADLLSEKAALSKDIVGVAVAEADLAVATSEARRLEAWVGYLKLPAPFDGVIVARNANTYDFVLPATGDPSTDNRAPHLSPSATAAPIYVVDRTDIVRIFVDIPERDANYVNIGTKASVLVEAYRDEPIPASVTRTSWALNPKSRTLRAEIDLKNPGSELLPGMYAYAKVTIERDSLLTLPVSALTHSGEKTFCWTLNGDRAERNEIKTGISDGEFIEVTNILLGAGDKGAAPRWTPVDGSERILLGDLSILVEGGAVAVKGDSKPEATTAASPKPPERPASGR